MITKENVANSLYAFATIFSVTNLAGIVAVHWKFIVSGMGIGSFAAPWFVAYFAISGLAWLVGFILVRHRNWTLVYWATIFVGGGLFFLLPTQFFVE